jgi:hypothetical protein
MVSRGNLSISRGQISEAERLLMKTVAEARRSLPAGHRTPEWRSAVSVGASRA